MGRNRKVKPLPVLAHLKVKVNWYTLAMTGGPNFELWFKNAYEPGTDVWLIGYNANGVLSVMLPNRNTIEMSKAEVDVMPWPEVLEAQNVTEYEALPTIEPMVQDGECTKFRFLRTQAGYKAR